jgi:hypothetical protein
MAHDLRFQAPAALVRVVTLAWEDLNDHATINFRAEARLNECSADTDIGNRTAADRPECRSEQYREVNIEPRSPSTLHHFDFG